MQKYPRSVLSHPGVTVFHCFYSSLFLRRTKLKCLRESLKHIVPIGKSRSHGDIALPLLCSDCWLRRKLKDYGFLKDVKCIERNRKEKEGEIDCMDQAWVLASRVRSLLLFESAGMLSACKGRNDTRLWYLESRPSSIEGGLCSLRAWADPLHGMWIFLIWQKDFYLYTFTETLTTF